MKLESTTNHEGEEPVANNPANTNDNESKNGISSIADAINNAEEFKNPLDNLVERCKKDPGVAFKPEVIQELASLKKEDLSKFESLRAKLGKTRCRLREIDAEIKKENGDNGHKPNQTDILINFAEDEGVELFHTEDKEAYVDVDNGEQRETYKVRSKEFKRWLQGRFFEETNNAATSESLKLALGNIEAKAIFQGKKQKVFLRVGRLDGRIYMDLGGDNWQAVEVDTEGWRITAKPPVRFRRTTGMKEIPAPKPGGSIDDFKKFLNVGSHHDFVLVVAWLLASLREHGPYPVIVLSGEHGAAKTTFSNILRTLIDPNKSLGRALPRGERELFIAANNAHLLTFDNLSYLQTWVSDALCRLSTGGCFGTRKLHTDQDEILFEATRPTILNGIEDIVTRSDLADRSLFFTLKPIPEDARLTEEELWRDFEKKRPYILGVLLDAVVEGLKRIGEVKLPTLPRMADFAKWGVACETALWDEGTFWNAYERNRKDVVENVIDGDPVANAICSLMEEKTEWQGTHTELLGELEKEAGERISESKSFPKNANALSRRLRRSAPSLRKIGVEIEHRKEGRVGKRMVYIKKDSKAAGY